MSVYAIERPADHPLIASIWLVQNDHAATFISRAAIHSEMVFACIRGQTSVTMRGPERTASSADIAADGQWLGMTFKPGTFLPMLPPKLLRDRHDVQLPSPQPSTVVLAHQRLEIPTFDNAEGFVARLLKHGLLQHDDLIAAVLQGEQPRLPARTLQHRFLRATGLSHSRILQIERAYTAERLLQEGMSIIDTAAYLGFYDQSHLTNTLKRLLGATPAIIALGAATP